MKKLDISVSELVAMITRGELRLPEMQRRYVWRAPRVRDLLDSLYRHYPSGSVLVWETEQAAPSRDLSIEQAKTPFATSKLLLDGQQRLTSLSAVLRGEPIKVRGRKRPIEILFNLDHPEGGPLEVVEVLEDEDSPVAEDDDSEDEGDDEAVDLQERLKLRTFVVASKQLAALPNWVPVSLVFREESDAPILKKAGITSFEDPRYEKYTKRLQRLRKIRDYQYVMHVLERELDYEEVAEIFVRVNSLGVKLRGSDLALAQITARWQNSLKLMETFQEECEERWFTLDLGLLVRMMVVFASKQCRFKSVAGISKERLEKGWDAAKSGLNFAINFLRSNGGIEDESLLSSPFLFVPIAAYSQIKENKLSSSESNQLLYWLHVANAKGRYSRGSSESLLDEDLKILFEGGTPSDLLKPMQLQFGRLHVEPDDLKGRGQRHPLFSLAYLALKAAGAKDWDTQVGISLAHQGRLHYIQFHHFFPKSLLKQQKYDKDEINEIANMAFIGGGTNRRISNRPPEVYVPELIKKHGSADLLASQRIPLDSKLHKMESYRSFLEARRIALAKVINEFMQASLK